MFKWSVIIALSNNLIVLFFPCSVKLFSLIKNTFSTYGSHLILSIVKGSAIHGWSDIFIILFLYTGLISDYYLFVCMLFIY